MKFSEEQQRRLGEIGASAEDVQADFPDEAQRNRAYQRLETRLTAAQQRRLAELRHGERRPFVLGP